MDEVLVIAGDKVARGAPLMHIHSHELATAVRDFASAEAQLTAAQSAYDRSQRLLADEAVPREEVERRRAALDQARAEYARSREVVDHLSPSSAGRRHGSRDAGRHRLRRARARWRRGHSRHAAGGPGGRAPAVGHRLRAGECGRPRPAGHAGRRSRSMPCRTRSMAQVVRMGGVVDSLRRAVEVRVALDRVPPGVRPGMFASVVLPMGARPAGRCCRRLPCSAWPMATSSFCRRRPAGFAPIRCGRCRWMAAAWRSRA